MCLIYLLYYAEAKSEADEQDVRFEDTTDKQNEGGGKEERIQNVTEKEGGVQERRRTTNDMSTSEGNEMTTTPSVVQPNLVCKNDDRGQCQLHGNLMIKLTINKRVWCDRGKGRGYGWRTKRIPKYICRDAKKIPEAPSVSSKSSDRAK